MIGTLGAILLTETVGPDFQQSTALATAAKDSMSKLNNCILKVDDRTGTDCSEIWNR